MKLLRRALPWSLLAVVSLALVGLPATASAQSLTTTYVGGNGWSGNMFDVEAINRVQIERFDAHLHTGQHTVDVYWRAGSHVGVETDSTAWTHVGRASVTGNGEGTATPVPLDVDVVIPAGQTYSFYVTSNLGYGAGNIYTNGGAVGEVYVQDADGDGVVDTEDACPLEAGQGDGCPNVEIDMGDPGVGGEDMSSDGGADMSGPDPGADMGGAAQADMGAPWVDSEVGCACGSARAPGSGGALGLGLLGLLGLARLRRRRRL